MRSTRCAPGWRRSHADPVAGLPPFQGGVAGYIGYDWGLTLERLPAPRYDDLALPDVMLGMYDWVLAWDHVASRAWLISTGMPETDRRRRTMRERVHARPNASALEPSASDPDLAPSPTRTLAGWPSDRPLPPSHLVEKGWWDPRRATVVVHPRRLLDAVQRVREYIFAGDIFQANLSQRFEAPLGESPWAFYSRLRSRNPAPFAAFFETPEGT